MKIKIGMTLVILCAIAIHACSGNSPAPPSQNSAPPPTAVAGNAQNGQVVITGAINKTYTPKELTAVKIGDRVGINVNESDVCGVSLQVPIDIQPGTYPIEDHLHSPVVNIFGEYDAPFCDDTPSELKHVFSSTQGTLTLTMTGKKFSGTFQFTAGNVKDESKTIQVSGSFRDAALP